MKKKCKYAKVQGRMKVGGVGGSLFSLLTPSVCAFAMPYR